MCYAVVCLFVFRCADLRSSFVAFALRVLVLSFYCDVANCRCLYVCVPSYSVISVFSSFVPLILRFVLPCLSYALSACLDCLVCVIVIL